MHQTVCPLCQPMTENDETVYRICDDCVKDSDRFRDLLNKAVSEVLAPKPTEWK